jgi:hypothetical protein
MRPRWSPEINFGHVLQAAMLVVVMGGGVLGSYLTLRADIRNQRADVIELRRSLETLIAQTTAHVLVLETLRPLDENSAARPGRH